MHTHFGTWQDRMLLYVYRLGLLNLRILLSCYWLAQVRLTRKQQQQLLS